MTGRQTDKQPNMQIDRQTIIEMDKQTRRQTNMLTDKKQAYRQKTGPQTNSSITTRLTDEQTNRDADKNVMQVFIKQCTSWHNLKQLQTAKHHEISRTFVKHFHCCEVCSMMQVV